MLIPIFLASSALERGDKKSVHFNGIDENIELLLRAVISANQLSVYLQICANELSKDLGAPGETSALDHLETMEILACPSAEETQTNAQQRGNLVQENERKFEQLSEDKKLAKPCSDAGLKLVETGPWFQTLDTEGGQQVQHLCRAYTMPRNEKKDLYKGLDSQEYKNRLSLGHKYFTITMIDTVSMFKFHLYLKTIPLLNLEL